MPEKEVTPKAPLLFRRNTANIDAALKGMQTLQSDQKEMLVEILMLRDDVLDLDKQLKNSSIKEGQTVVDLQKSFEKRFNELKEKHFPNAGDYALKTPALDNMSHNLTIQMVKSIEDNIRSVAHEIEKKTDHTATSPKSSPHQ